VPGGGSTCPAPRLPAGARRAALPREVKKKEGGRKNKRRERKTKKKKRRSWVFLFKTPGTATM